MRASALALCWSLFPIACTRSDELVRSLDAGPQGGAVDGGDAGEVSDAGEESGADAGKLADAEPADAGPEWILDEAGTAFCGRAPCACSNGLDDDADGVIDGFDPECTGASDQFEDSFATGAQGEEQDRNCQDCFFDSNSGSGGGDCKRPTSCALDGSESSGNGSCKSCEASASCAAACEPLVPNGCDCFGCCGVWRDGVEISVLLRPTCSLAALHDATLCPPCVRATDCLNPCATCELCPGLKLADLPESCRRAGGPGYACEDAQVCTAGNCPIGQYCQLGCCTDIGI